MRVFEVVEHHAAEVKRVVALGDAADLLEQLRLPGGIETAAADEGAARAGDLVVVDVPARAEATAGLADAVTGVPDGATLLLLLRAPLAELPVGPVVSALTQAGLQAVEASPVAHTTFTAAVVARRPDGGMLPFVPYLGDRVLVGPEDGQVRRVVNEHLVEGLVSRARDVDRDRLREDLRSAQADVTNAREAFADVVRQLERERARLRALEASRTMAVGRAVAEVRRNPVRGLVRLPGALRGRGQPNPSASPSSASPPP
jgi:hypothetical protein